MMDNWKRWTAFREGRISFREVINPFRKIDKDDDQWFSISGTRNRDLSDYTQDHVADIAYHQWITNPVAGRVIEMVTDFIVGDGVEIKAQMENEDQSNLLQSVLDDFWFDPINDFEEQQIAIITERQIFGELVFIPFVNPVSGLVRLARIEPTLIKQVLSHEKYPQVPVKIILKAGTARRVGQEDRSELDIIRMDDDPESPNAGKLSGDAFYFWSNKIGVKKRGHSQLFRTHEWFDVYDKRLFSEAERQQLLNNWIWDVTLKGASQEQAQKMMDSVETPLPGGVRVHPDNVEWKALAPDLKAQEFAESNRQFLQLILGSFGIPEHYFALGGEVNFATAKAMAEPTLRKFKRDQRSFRCMVEKLVDYQIEKAIQAGRLVAQKWEYEVLLDEISAVDLASVTGAVANLAVTLQTAEIQNWIDRPEAANAFAKFFSQTGTEIEPLKDETIPPSVANATANFLTTFESFQKKKKQKRRTRVYHNASTA